VRNQGYAGTQMITDGTRQLGERVQVVRWHHKAGEESEGWECDLERGEEVRCEQKSGDVITVSAHTDNPLMQVSVELIGCHYDPGRLAGQDAWMRVRLCSDTGSLVPRINITLTPKKPPGEEHNKPWGGIGPANLWGDRSLGWMLAEPPVAPELSPGNSSDESGEDELSSGGRDEEDAQEEAGDDPPSSGWDTAEYEGETSEEFRLRSAVMNVGWGRPEQPCNFVQKCQPRYKNQPGEGQSKGDKVPTLLQLTRKQVFKVALKGVRDTPGSYLVVEEDRREGYMVPQINGDFTPLTLTHGKELYKTCNESDRVKVRQDSSELIRRWTGIPLEMQELVVPGMHVCNAHVGTGEGRRTRSGMVVTTALAGSRTQESGSAEEVCDQEPARSTLPAGFRPTGNTGGLRSERGAKSWSGAARLETIRKSRACLNGPKLGAAKVGRLQPSLGATSSVGGNLLKKASEGAYRNQQFITEGRAWIQGSQKVATQMPKSPHALLSAAAASASAAASVAAEAVAAVAAAVALDVRSAGKTETPQTEVGQEAALVRVEEQPATGRGRKRRGKYNPTAEFEEKIDAKIRSRFSTKKHLRHDANTRHYVEFCESTKRDPVVCDPLDIENQRHMERYIAYESCLGLKGHSIEAKLVGVNAAHESLGLVGPFSVSPIVRGFLSELKAADAPPVYRVPVDPSASEYYALTHDLEEPDARQIFEAQCVGRAWCMRASEYLGNGGGKARTDALQWKDVYFRKKDGEFLQGREVECAGKVTLSISSNKNAYGRCSRTKEVVREDPLDAGKVLAGMYLRILKRTGETPRPGSFVFELESKPGKVLSRDAVSASIQDILEKFGVPRKMAGSHSLRRGGATIMRAAGVPDEDIKRWGRWTSDAYKLYVHVVMDSMDGWGAKIAAAKPVYELN
jgi:hypothetical protein